MSPKSIAVIGGGITGLAAAYYLKQQSPEHRVQLFESNTRLGGNIITEERDGFVIDGGPDSFLRTKPYAVNLCRELGLAPKLITTRPEARKVYIAHQGRLELMPGGMALAIPTRISPMLKTPILSWLGKLRILGDLMLDARESAPDDDESIEGFVARRFGQEVADKIAGPLLGGIYAGDVGQLSLRSTFPQLAELEAKYRSVILGMLLSQKPPDRAGAQTLGQLSPQEIFQWLTRAEAAAPSPFYSLEGGMGSLIAALHRSLRPEDVHVGARVERLLQLPGKRWQLQFSGNSSEAPVREPCDVDAILLAAPARVAAKLLAQRELAEELSSIPYVSTATVFFALNQEDVAHPLDGLGFIAPKGEAEILAGTWVSSKWEHRAPPGKALVRAFLGGSRGTVKLAGAADAELEGVALSELERLMGPLGTPLFSKVFRYMNSNPQPVVGHMGRLARIRAHASRLGRLELAGAAYEGVGIPDCIRQAKTAAERLLQELC
ncbi:MAG: protoporphyrinogen oxidase [Polyangiaceae bacterium]|nr:protoporphyrinogen oxidase [Polyangiaceae bacterium]